MYIHSLSSVFILLSSVITLLLFCGCADDLRNRSVFDSGAGDAVIRFSIEDVTLTREGESEDIESVVDHAYLLFYSGDASLLTDVPLAAVRAEVDQAAYGNLKFKMPLSLTPNTNYQLLAIANADDYVPSGFENFGEYLESWCRNSTSSDKNPIHLYCTSVISPAVKANLPMSGGVKEGSYFRFSLDNGVYTVASSLSFRRMVARIDVANIIKDGFEVEGVALCNWRDAMPIASYSSQIGNRFGSVQGCLSNDGDTLSRDKFVDMPSTDETGIQQLNKRIYCFPSVSYDSSLGDQESMALIIKAKYGEDSESTYYRVNVGMQGNVSKVDPNTKYLVTIRSVKGRGASTPEEAYFATESQIVLSVVEGWDLDGNAFDMDDFGNFIVLSKGCIEFDGDDTDNVEVRVLASKGLEWTAEYIAENEISASAFNVEKLSDTAIVIAPRGENEEEEPLTGKCMVSATTEAGTTLQVDIALSQAVAEVKPYEPEIPTHMPFSIIPLEGERVKINHNEHTIEIDGFDPDCFNSFIDIPFKVYINDTETNVSSITISSTLEWPLEGRISTSASSDYLYCKSSFSGKGSAQVSLKNGDLVNYNTLYTSSISVQKDRDFYISVGAMAPDDPSINRIVTISSNGENIVYSLTIKPRPIIIDDIVLEDSDGSLWLIQDRNIQDFILYEKYVGYKYEGKKYQAYNYTNYAIVKDGNNYRSFIMPFKFQDQNGTAIIENQHELYRGKQYILGSTDLSSDNEKVVSRLSWLKKYCYSQDMKKTSPFYEEENIQDWIFPTESVIKLWGEKLKVSKMRMFLISEVPVKNKKTKIPICCYIPYYTLDLGTHNSSETYGYHSSNSGVKPEFIVLIYFDLMKGETYKTSNTKFTGLSRLVRPLTEKELEDYKQNYLGYGSQPHKLTICHPDTYESTPYGWIPY